MLRGEFKLIDNDKLYTGQYNHNENHGKEVIGYILDFNRERTYRPKYFLSAMTRSLYSCHVNTLYGSLKKFEDFDRLVLCMRAVKNKYFRHEDNLLVINSDNHSKLVDHNENPLLIKSFVEDCLYVHSLYAPGDSLRDLFTFCSLPFEIPLIERALKYLEEEGFAEKGNKFASDNRWSYDHKLTQRGLEEIRPRFKYKPTNINNDLKTSYSNNEKYDFFISHTSDNKEKIHMTNEELIKSLISRPSETEWIEFKQDNAKPEEIGEYISALSNSAALHKKPYGYIIWGINDKSHDIIGTEFKPKLKKVGNEEIENWLAIHLRPRINFDILEWAIDDKKLVVFKIQAASYTPVGFNGTEYIRIGTLKKKLGEYPEKERILWSLFKPSSFESGITTVNSDSNTNSPQIMELSQLQIEMLVRSFRNEGQIHRRPIDQNTNDRIIIGVWGTPNEANNNVFLQYINALEKLESLDYIERKGPNLYVLKLKGNDEAQRLISEGYKIPE